MAYRAMITMAVAPDSAGTEFGARSTYSWQCGACDITRDHIDHVGVCSLATEVCRLSSPRRSKMDFAGCRNRLVRRTLPGASSTDCNVVMAGKLNKRVGGKFISSR
jgi:hypothetical protein